MVNNLGFREPPGLRIDILKGTARRLNTRKIGEVELLEQSHRGLLLDSFLFKMVQGLLNVLGWGSPRQNRNMA